MGPKTYLMSFCLFMSFLEAQSCSSSSSKPAAAKFHAESNNGIWWPEDRVNSDRTNTNGNDNYHLQHHNSYELPEISNETGVNGIGSSNNNYNSDNNEEQLQITASIEPQQQNINYYREENGSGTSEGSSSSTSDLIESSVPEQNQNHYHYPQEQEQSRSRSSSDDGRTSSATSSNSNNRRLAKSTEGLELVHFSNKSITCNDGSPSGYYIRKSSFRGNDDNLWIIFLEGGWYCFDQRSCMNRWHRLNHLMSSVSWPSSKHVGGILSSDPNENPYWWNANHVFIPYCSSDTWSGRARGNENGQMFSFMGALIIDEVVKTLIEVEGLDSDSSVILAGSSAGGTGVMINLDHVESLLTQEFGPADGHRVKGITDSGWFIDKVPLYSEKVNCQDVILCPPEISLRKGMNLWNARLPESCQDSHPDEPWSCFFGYRLYPSLKASLFVFQWLFDEAQMIVNNVPTPALKKEEWDYVYKVGDELKKTLLNVTNAFIPSCLAHTILTNRDWGRVEVNSVELTRALKCWESGGIIEESNFIPKRKSSQVYWDEEESSLQLSGHRGLHRHGKVYTSSTPISLASSTATPSNDSFNTVVVSNDSRRNRRRHNRHRHNKQSRSSNTSTQNHRQNRRRRKKLEKRLKLEKESGSSITTRTTNFAKNKQRPRSVDTAEVSVSSMKIAASRKRNASQTASTSSSTESSASPNLRNTHANHPSGKKNKHKKRKRNRRWYSVCDVAPGILRGGRSAASTEIRIIEKCSWPQCNKSCPKLLNPLTGEEVDFKDLLKSFGLDLATMAKALGIDLATLNSMDHQVLLQMLTQNA